MMSRTHWSRRDFVARSTAALGTIGTLAAAGSRGEAHNEEPNMAYSDLLNASIEELPTPALMIDLDIFERNIKTMQDACQLQHGKYRPHGKAHKSALVGKKQLAAGAGGLCAAK